MTVRPTCVVLVALLATVDITSGVDSVCFRNMALALTVLKDSLGSVLRIKCMVLNFALCAFRMLCLLVMTVRRLDPCLLTLLTCLLPFSAYMTCVYEFSYYTAKKGAVAEWAECGVF